MEVEFRWIGGFEWLDRCVYSLKDSCDLFPELFLAKAYRSCTSNDSFMNS